MSGIDLGGLLDGVDPAMVVVTTRSTVDGEHGGCLVGFHAQASIAPERYAIWLSQANRTHRLARHATHVAVHLLASSDHAIAERFGGVSGDDLPDDGDGKFAGLGWRAGPGGVPVLDGIERWFVGRIAGWSPSEGPGWPDADHACLLLEPVERSTARSEGWVPLRLSDASDIDAGHDA